MKAAPAIKGKMGSIEYYETKLTGRELANSVRPVKESEKWSSTALEDRIQRTPDLIRVREELVPYLAQHEDRFWGSIIVLAEEGMIEFEPLTDVVGKVGRAYQSAVESMGFITCMGGELIALDGQHRWYALRELITSTEDLGEFQRLVGDDEMSVIVIQYQSAEKTRRIFNKVNRHAKATGRSDNILLSEDDGWAIVTRMLLDPGRSGPLADVKTATDDQPIVNWKSTTLTKTMRHLTTISVVYDTVKHILTSRGFNPDKWDEKKNPVRPDDKEIDSGFADASSFWETVMTSISIYDQIRSGTMKLNTIRDIRFNDDDARSLLLRPVGQVALVRGVLRAMENSKGKLSLEEALKRADKINWSASSTNYFRDTIVRANGSMSARDESYRVASHLIAYLIGDEFLNDDQRRNIWRDWNKARGALVEASDGEKLTDAQIEAELKKLDEEEAKVKEPTSLPTPV